MTTGRLASLLAGRRPRRGVRHRRSATCSRRPTRSRRCSRRTRHSRRRGGPTADRRTPERAGSACVDTRRRGRGRPATRCTRRSCSTIRAAPAVLFVRGDLGVLDARRVGIVGTRNATQRGPRDRRAVRLRARRRAAWPWCRVSPRASTVRRIVVPSPSTAPHRWRIVGNGPDRPYPKQHTALWTAVCRARAR